MSIGLPIEDVQRVHHVFAQKYRDVLTVVDQPGSLSRSEFTEHWTEFSAGDDPAAPGSWVFGSFPVGVGHD